MKEGAGKKGEDREASEGKKWKSREVEKRMR